MQQLFRLINGLSMHALLCLSNIFSLGALRIMHYVSLLVLVATCSLAKGAALGYKGKDQDCTQCMIYKSILDLTPATS